MSANAQQLAEEFRDVYDRMRECVNDLKVLMRSLPRHKQEQAKAYWFGQMQISLDDDHDFVSDKYNGNLLQVVEWVESEVPEDDEEIGDWENEPVEGDITTKDHKEFYQDGKMILSVPEDADHCAALAIWMKDNGIFPSVWFISDHGNAELIEMGEYLD